MDIPIRGIIWKLEHDGEWGVDRATIQCPQCGQEIKVDTGETETCACGLEWRIEVNAFGYPKDEDES